MIRGIKQQDIKKGSIFLVLTMAILSSAFAKKAESPKIPQRIVSLSPAGSEILCAVGAIDQIVARTDYCDYPEKLTALPTVGGFDGKTLSLEKIVSYKPDFVYGSKGMHDYLVPSLNKMGISVYLSDAKSLDAVYTEIAYIGQFTGHAEAASQVVAGMKAKITAIHNKIESYYQDASKKGTTKNPAVYYEVWNSPFMSAGRTSFISELISTAGGRNIFGDLADEYPMVSEEAILARKPEVILIPDMESETIDSLGKRNGWKMIPAVQDKKIYFVDSNICSRPGPRITQAVLILAKAIHPEIDFSDIQ